MSTYKFPTTAAELRGLLDAAREEGARETAKFYREMGYLPHEDVVVGEAIGFYEFDASPLNLAPAAPAPAEQPDPRDTELAQLREDLRTSDIRNSNLEHELGQLADNVAGFLANLNGLTSRDVGAQCVRVLNTLGYGPAAAAAVPLGAPGVERWSVVRDWIMRFGERAPNDIWLEVRRDGLTADAYQAVLLRVAALLNLADALGTNAQALEKLAQAYADAAEEVGYERGTSRHIPDAVIDRSDLLKAKSAFLTALKGIHGQQ